VYADFNLQAQTALPTKEPMDFNIDLTVSFFSTHESLASSACHFPTAKHDSQEVTEHLSGKGEEHKDSWKALVRAKKIKTHVKCATTVDHDVPAGNDDGFTKPKLTCDNVLLLAGDMPNFQEFAGVEVIVTKATSTGKKLS